MMSLHDSDSYYLSKRSLDIKKSHKDDCVFQLELGIAMLG